MSIQLQADDFFNAYLVLKDNSTALMERLEKSPGKPLIGTKELGTRITGGVEIVCLAFSVELYIKALHCAIRGEAPRGHKILELFDELPEQIRQEIFAHDSISQNPFITRGSAFSVKKFASDFSAYDGFREQIEAISDGFTKWRYSHESKALHYDTSFALTFIEVLKFVAGRVRDSV